MESAMYQFKGSLRFTSFVLIPWLQVDQARLFRADVVSAKLLNPSLEPQPQQIVSIGQELKAKNQVAEGKLRWPE
jgi:hypothetical protein